MVKAFEKAEKETNKKKNRTLLENWTNFTGKYDAMKCGSWMCSDDGIRIFSKGDMQDRNVLHLYVQKDGSIGKTQYYKGIDEIEEFYENTSTDTADLESKSKEKLESLMNKQTFEMDVEELGIDIAIGDIVGGRDYRTGLSMTRPLENIIVIIKGESVKKEYKLEGANV